MYSGDKLMPSLDYAKHAALLTRITDAVSSRGHLVTDWDRNFCKDIRAKAEDRESTVEICGAAWNPSVKQWNCLTGIGDKLGIDR